MLIRLSAPPLTGPGSQQFVVAKQVVELNLVYAWKRDVGDEAVECQYGEGEKNLGSEVGQTERVYGRL